jgi:hypothetical protein
MDAVNTNESSALLACCLGMTRMMTSDDAGAYAKEEWE